MWLETLFLILHSCILNKGMSLTDLFVLNLEMKRHCHYKQSLVLFHANDLWDYYNFDFNTYKRTITKRRFNKDFHQYSYAFKCREFADSNKHAQFSAIPFAMWQNVFTRSITIPEVFVFLFPNFIYKSLPITIHACVLI